MLKILGWLLIAGAVFYVIRAPETSADIVRSTGEWLGNAAASVAGWVRSAA